MFWLQNKWSFRFAVKAETQNKKKEKEVETLIDFWTQPLN